MISRAPCGCQKRCLLTPSFPGACVPPVMLSTVIPLAVLGLRLPLGRQDVAAKNAGAQRLVEGQDLQGPPALPAARDPQPASVKAKGFAVS